LKEFAFLLGNGAFIVDHASRGNKETDPEEFVTNNMLRIDTPKQDLETNCIGDANHKRETKTFLS
jgi:hypothetical protein